MDGDGSSFIDTGPGRNRVILGHGDDEVVVGTGENRIQPGTGAVTFRISYGGVCVIERWDAAQHYDLTAWPAQPTLSHHPDWGGVRIRLALSIVDVIGAPDCKTLSAQISQ
jgi:hypothetical protein